MKQARATKNVFLREEDEREGIEYLFASGEYDGGDNDVHC